mmetsp:Transcript_144109/g.461336  ORF Transcript_144109/g.461336 Transcript_144109/m.461336 type:complete len:219 (+) Transcript_144109:828-1484(+)
MHRPLAVRDCDHPIAGVRDTGNAGYRVHVLPRLGRLECEHPLVPFRGLLPRGCFGDEAVEDRNALLVHTVSLGCLACGPRLGCDDHENHRIEHAHCSGLPDRQDIEDASHTPDIARVALPSRGRGLQRLDGVGAQRALAHLGENIQDDLLHHHHEPLFCLRLVLGQPSARWWTSEVARLCTPPWLSGVSMGVPVHDFYALVTDAIHSSIHGGVPRHHG